MIFVYGIDLAQSLNYTAIIVVSIEKKKIRIVAVRKYKNLKYPELHKILFDDLFKRFPPRLVVVDYTNEKSFSETIEAEFNSSFMNSNSSEYHKWKKVKPVTFTQDIKLEMKQNARQILERKQFAWPNRWKTDPRVWSLIEELIEQALRESGNSGSNDQLKFSKPEGHDNDLIIALELSLYGAKEFLYNDPEDWGRTEPYNPMEKYTCNQCKQENHPHTIHMAYFDDFGGQRDCACRICNAT